MDIYISINYIFLEKVVSKINVDAFRNYYSDIIDSALVKSMLRNKFEYYGGDVVITRKDISILLAYFENDDLNELITQKISDTKQVDDYFKEFILKLIELNNKKNECDGCNYGWGAQQDHSCLYPDLF